MKSQLIALLCLTVSQITLGCKFGLHCDYLCHCKNFEPCNVVTGHCENGCDSEDVNGYLWRGNWSGPACQEGNVAYGKPATQRDIVEHYDAGLAVDGNLDPVLANSHCSHVQWSGQGGAWWQVDLVDHYRIFSVTIYNANTNQGRIKGISVYITAENDDDKHSQCGSTSGGAEAMKTVTCSPSIVGRYVRLEKNGHLQLCEVMVTGYLYRFEHDSTAVATSGGNTNGAPCVFPFQYKSITYNSCISLAHDELWCSTKSRYGDGEKWSECLDCPLDYFGAACITSCNCDEPCDHITGHCPGDCVEGWAGDDCQIAIPMIGAPSLRRQENGRVLLSGLVPVDDDSISVIHVAIEIKQSNLSDWAVVSRESVTGDFRFTYQPELTDGLDYDFRVTPLFDIDGQTHAGTTSPVVSTSSQDTGTGPTNVTPSRGTTIGIILAAIFAIIIVTIIIGVLVWRSQRSKKLDGVREMGLAGENIYEEPPAIALAALPATPGGGSQLDVVAEEDEEDLDDMPSFPPPEPPKPMLDYPVYENSHANTIEVDILMTYVDELKKVPNGFLREYELIPRKNMGTTVEAHKPGNRHKHRFRDISAYDHSRVILKRDDEGQSDYINANHVPGYNRPDESDDEETENPKNAAAGDGGEEDSELYENIKLSEVTNDAAAADPWREYINIARLKREDRMSSRKAVSPLLRGGDRTSSRPSSLYVNSVQLQASGKRVRDKTAKNYIASQGPVWDTREDFLDMIWQQNVNRVVMLTKIVEDGKAKCECYWPDPECIEIGSFHLSQLQKDTYADYVIREFIMKRGEETHTVRHFHFTGWPDQGLPDFATSIIDFREKVRSYDMAATGPMLVHCSAGIGRTGTFIALDYLLNQSKHESQVDVVQCVSHLRLARPCMVQNLDQYVFVYDGLLEATISKETAINSAQMKRVYRNLHAANPDSGKSEIEDQYELLAALRPISTTRYTQEGTKSENIKKNRSLAIIPRDHRRVRLKEKEEFKNDYINAVFVDGYRDKKNYILTQLPLENTVVEFWRMMVDHDIHSVVYLNQPPANGEDAQKDEVVCWPDMNDVRKTLGPITIEYMRSYTHPSSRLLTIIEFSISREDDDETHELRQYKIDWRTGDDAISQITNILDVINIVGRWQRKTKNKPIVIQCRDGAELSGLYCCACYLLEKIQIDQEVDVFLAVKQVRAARPPIIQTIDQYKFLHALALEYIESFDNYANFQ